jgi:hypothetical protein
MFVAEPAMDNRKPEMIAEHLATIALPIMYNPVSLNQSNP